MNPPRVLVTNDDGIHAEGLRRLALVAEDVGLDVVVAAPLEQSSGSSAAITAVEEDGQVLVERIGLDGLGADAFGVAAKPALIVLIASRGAFGPPPDIVLSGINHGVNLGQVVLHSGTVGAALTACQQGARAMAVSAEVAEPMPWGRAAEVARAGLGWLMDQDEPLAINVNVPARGEDCLPVIAELDPSGVVQTEISERREGSFVVTMVAHPEVRPPVGSDTALVQANRPTITVLRPVCAEVGTLLEPAFNYP